VFLVFNAQIVTWDKGLDGDTMVVVMGLLQILNADIVSLL
jgi:hypothetical protein